MIRIVVPSYMAGATTANGVDAKKACCYASQFLSCPSGCGKMFSKQKQLHGHEKGCDFTTPSDSDTSTSPAVQDTCTRYKNRKYHFESEQMMCVCMCVCVCCMVYKRYL